jgi:hypothetical protein
MEEFVLVVVTSETCGHCHRYLSQQHQDLISKLSGIGNLNIIHLAFNSKNEIKAQVLKGNIDARPYLPQIRKIIGWFPEFILSKKNTLMSEWKIGTKPDLWIVNGNLMEDTSGGFSVATDASGGVPLTSEGISRWVTSKLSTPSTLSAPAKKPAIMGTHGTVLKNRGHGFMKFNPSSEPEDY